MPLAFLISAIASLLPSTDDPFFPRHGIRGDVEAFTGPRSATVGSQDLGHSRVDCLQAEGEGSVALSKDAASGNHPAFYIFLGRP